MEKLDEITIRLLIERVRKQCITEDEIEYMIKRAEEDGLDTNRMREKLMKFLGATFEDIVLIPLIAEAAAMQDI